MFGLQPGSDIQVFILDNHRPIHLKNKYSDFNVVVFDSAADSDLVNYPSDGSDLSDSDFFDESDEEDEDDDDDNDRSDVSSNTFIQY